MLKCCKNAKAVIDMRTPEQTAEIVARLEEAYPLADCTLDWGKDYELLFSVRLAAQCTDERVNMITPALFERYPTLKDFAEADVAEVEKYIRSCGFSTPRRATSSPAPRCCSPSTAARCRTTWTIS